MAWGSFLAGLVGRGAPSGPAGGLVGGVSGWLGGTLDSVGGGFGGTTSQQIGTAVGIGAGAIAGVLAGAAGAAFLPAFLFGLGASALASWIGENLADYFLDPPASPLVFDLDGDGIELTSLDGNTAFFDVDVNGFAEATGWVAPDDGLLALDVDGDGQIDDGSELFGDQTGYDHGFLALAAHDTNADGVIDANDAVFSDLLTWQDANSDGVSQAEEMRSLAEVGITSISVNATATNYQVAGNDILWESSFTWSDGSQGIVADAFFETDTLDTVALLPDDFTYHPDVAKLPVFTGVGALASSLVSFTQDDALRQQAIDLVALASSGDISGFFEEFESFVMAWGGADDVAEGSRGPYIDARYITFLENVFEQSFSQGDPRPQAGAQLTESVHALLYEMAGQFLAQVAISDALLNGSDEASYEAILTENPLTGVFGTDVPTAFDDILDGYDDGTFSLVDANLLLGVLEHNSDDAAVFAVELSDALSNTSSANAAL